MLGQPAFVAGHGRGDAQREALLAEQGVAAVARNRRTRSRGSRVVDDVLGVRVARPARILSPWPSGAPTVCTQGTYSPLVPSTSKTPLPMRVMVRMLTRRRGCPRSRCRCARSASRAGPSRTARRTSCGPHAAGEQAVQRLAHLGRFFPVVGRAGVILVLRADVGAVFDARDVEGSDQAR